MILEFKEKEKLQIKNFTLVENSPFDCQTSDNKNSCEGHLWLTWNAELYIH